MRPDQLQVCLIAGALALASLPAGAQSQLPAATKVDPGSAASGFAPTAYAASTAEFERDARELDAAQVQLAEIAQRKGSPQVQAFAKQVRMAFTGGRPSLKGMSDDKGIPVVGTAKLAREHQTLVTQLQANGADVDRLFVDYEALVLRAAIGAAQSYAIGGVDARLRQAASEAVSAEQDRRGPAPMLQQPGDPPPPAAAGARFTL